MKKSEAEQALETFVEAHAGSPPVETRHALAQLLHFRQLLLEWNTRFNLTAITDPDAVLTRHFLDSLSLLLVYDRPRTRLLDLGSGAGLPGIPLKILRPDWQVTLLESTGKKVGFMQHVIETLGLEGIEAVQGRAEELARASAYRASFDLVSARAVASLPVLLEYAAPYCGVDGRMILPKKGDLAAELAQGQRAGELLGCSLQAAVPVTLPGLDDGRQLLVWRQERACPERYPRTGAAIAKQALG